MFYTVKTGIDRQDRCRAVFGKARLGLITSSSGISSDLRSSIDVLKENFDLRVLLAPEHGIRGVLGPGEKVGFQIDRFSGLPTYSLFEDHIFSSDNEEKDSAYLPPKEALDQIDMMVFDIQDVGSRYYTYPSTLFYAMRACASAGKKMVVLDRPNPIGGTRLEGNCHDPGLLSFIGLTRTPIRHGWTIGELAQYYNGEYHLGCDLEIVKMTGWKRDMFFDETGLPFAKPSPNLPTLDSVVVYNGSCLLAGTNVSEGRGTTTPFTTVGAPYINPGVLAKKMNAVGLEGLAFTPAFFIPAFADYPGQVCGGIQIHVREPKRVHGVNLGIYLIRTIQELYPEDFAFSSPPAGANYHIDIASGSSELRDNILTAGQLAEKWDQESAAFQPIHEKYKIYE